MNVKAKPVKIKYDAKITVAIGRSRWEKDWKNREMSWSQLVDKLSQTTRTRETLEEFDKLAKSQQDAIKDVGGFVGGTLKSGRRTAANAVWRQIVTLDADFAGADFWDTVGLMLGDCSCLVYSTHKHRPEKPRLRLVIPLSRPVTPDEYQAISRRIAADIGIDLFDDTTYQPHRLMYWPSTPADGEFVFHYNDGPWLSADEVLARYPDWRDQSFWPESSRSHKQRESLAKKQGDPHAKAGIVGAFCRTYSIPEAIDIFLPEIYEACAMEGRYTYKLGTAAAGLVLYEDKFAYSHHGTDPISGKLVNAFDLVRLHLFGEQDDEVEPGTPTIKLPSYLAMIDLASKDANVKRTLGEERLADANEDFKSTINDTNWLEQLDVNSKGQYVSTPENVILILEHDPNLAGKIAKDDFAHRVVVKDNLPWRGVEAGRFWSDEDDSGLRNYCHRVYGIKGKSIVLDALNEVLMNNRYHPVRDYLNSLWWDGEKRLDTLLIDYMGAEDSAYVRTVTRRMLVAAVARIMQPGIKFDNMLVLVGKQGQGKSFLLKKLGRNWFSDSLTTVQGKEAYEQLQGSWIFEMGELSAMRKAEVEAVKHFLSKQVDNFRVAYGRNISTFPRQCVFFGSTNRDDFLRDSTGNRRFWPVKTQVQPAKKSVFIDLTEYEIDQIWAEAAIAWQEGEPLYLDGSVADLALEAQEKHMEESPLTGIIREYIDRLLPENWEQMDLVARRNFIHNRDFGEAPEGTVQRQRVCALEIWAELLEGNVKQLTKLQALEINEALRRIKGWIPYKDGCGKLRFGSLYGVQKAFVRAE